MPNSHINETLRMNCGVLARVIAYRKSKDIDVEMTNALGETMIRKHVSYHEFCRGSIAPNPMGWAKHGQEFTLNDGRVVTVVQYINCDNCSIRWNDDGAEKHKVAMEHLKRGDVAHPSCAPTLLPDAQKSRLGAEKLMKCGHLARIITYNGYKDIDVQFDDGAIRYHTQYNKFLSGTIPHPDKMEQYRSYTYQKQHRLGLEAKNDNGMMMKIVEYHDASNIVVLFEDGAQVTTSWKAFHRNAVTHPTYNPKRLSRSEGILLYYFQQLGFQKFPQGYFRRYHPDFGMTELDLFHPQYKIAYEYDGWYHRFPAPIETDLRKEKLCAQVGIKMIKIRDASLPMHNYQYSIPRYQEDDDDELTMIMQRLLEMFNEWTHQSCTIDFNIRRDIDAIEQFRNVKDYVPSALRNPHNLGYCKKERIGEIHSNKRQEQLKIIEYENAQNVTIQFEDGTVRTGVRYTQIVAGTVYKDPTITKHHGATKGSVHIGEIYYNNNDDRMTIIQVNNTKDCAVQFDDGTILQHIQYARIARGAVLKPGVPRWYDTKRAQQRLGMTKVSNYGDTMTIIAYRNSKDIDVQFEDNTIVQHREFRAFQNGKIQNPNRLCQKSNHTAIPTSD